MSDDLDLKMEDIDGAPTDDWDDDDFSAGFRVNVSDKEASSEAFGAYQPLPKGEYHVAITDVSLEKSTSEKHSGKPYMRWELTVQGSKDKEDPNFHPYADRKVWSNVMCFEGALYSITQAMKAVGLPVSTGALDIPGPEWWVGKEMIAVVKQVPKMTKNESTGKYTEPEWTTELVGGKEVRRKVMQNDVSGFKPLSAARPGTRTAASGELTLQ